MAALRTKLSSYCQFLSKSNCFTQRRFQGTSTGNGDGVLVAIPEVRSFIERCMTSVNTKQDHAQALADNLVCADHRGHFSHGLNRIEIYVQDMQAGLCVSDTEPTLVRETAATALVSGNNLLGPVVGNFCMKVAIRKAKEAGIGWVVANESNHYGIAGYYGLQALKLGLIGLSFTNTSPLVVATRSRQEVIGTNPIAVFAPGTNGDSFELDMATSASALGKIELASVKGDSIPIGWGADGKGLVTTDPNVVLKEGAQLPLGGAESTSGYKGTGLGMMVEIFCGIMGDAKFGSDVRKWKTSERAAQLGQCFAVIDPDMIAPGFPGRMQKLMEMCRTGQPAEGETEILVAGDPEKRHIAKCDQEGGIRYHPNQIEKSIQLAKDLGIDPMKTL